MYFPLHAGRQDSIYNEHKDSLWQEFSQEALDKALSEKKVVFVDITADWCGTCQYNKVLVLDRAWTVNMLVRNKVVALRANLNNKNIAAEEFMHKYGAYSIPLNIVYGPAAPHGAVLPITYSYNELEQAIINAAKTSDK